MDTTPAYCYDISLIDFPVGRRTQATILERAVHVHCRSLFGEYPYIWTQSWKDGISISHTHNNHMHEVRLPISVRNHGSLHASTEAAASDCYPVDDLLLRESMGFWR